MLIPWFKKIAGLKTEMNVGLLLLAGLLFLGVASIKVTQYDPDLGGTYSLKVEFENVSGLAVGTSVKIAGIHVGQVTSIELVEGSAEVTISLFEKYRLRSNSKAAIKSIGILGDKYIEVTLGTSNQQALHDGDRIQLIEPASDLDSLVEDLSYILSDIRSVTNSVNTAIGGEKGSQQLQQIVSNVESLTTSLDQTLSKTNEKIGGILANLDSFSGDLKGITSENRGEFKHLLANLRDFSESLNRFIDTNEKDLNHTIENLDTLIASLTEDGPEITGDLKGILKENRDNLKQTMGEIRSASANLNSTMGNLDHITYTVDSGQGTLGRLINDEQTVNSIQSALDGVNELVDPLNKLRIEVGFQTEQLIDQGEYKSYVNVNLRPVRDHYYILKLVTNPNGKVVSSRTQTRDTSSDVVLTDVNEYKTYDTWALTLMVAQRYFDTELQFGLNEGTAGLGLHQYFGRNDQYRMNLDLFDFSRDNLPVHMRAGGYWKFSQNLYMVAGVDDALNTKNTTSGKPMKNPYAGVGISFTEDYVKSLLGTAGSALNAGP